MAEIAFPSIPLTQFEIQPYAQSIIRHSSLFTGSEQLHSRGIMVMQGTIGWSRRNVADRRAEIAMIEAFLVRVYGGVMTFKIPVPVNQKNRLLDVNDSNSSISALPISSVTQGLFETQFTADKGILLGDWVNFGDRLHKIVSVASDTTYKVTPAISDITESMGWHAPKLNARMTQQDVALPATGTWRGPWEISVQEVVE